jgi:hypothetical protein
MALIRIAAHIKERPHAIQTHFSQHRQHRLQCGRSQRCRRGATALEELIRSTVVVAHAPRWLDVEMASAIEQASRQYGLPTEALRERWKEFQALFIWGETLREPGQASSECCDPKDLPYVLLERKIGADGILSRDRHIGKLGGHPLTLDFVLSTRGYAREVVKTITLRVGGIAASEEG